MGKMDQKINGENKDKDAILSVDRKCRYVLTRTWDEAKPTVINNF